jgi:hypothetical protein
LLKIPAMDRNLRTAPSCHYCVSGSYRLGYSGSGSSIQGPSLSKKLQITLYVYRILRTAARFFLSEKF